MTIDTVHNAVRFARLIDSAENGSYEKYMEKDTMYQAAIQLAKALEADRINPKEISPDWENIIIAA